MLHSFLIASSNYSCKKKIYIYICYAYITQFIPPFSLQIWTKWCIPPVKIDNYSEIRTKMEEKKIPCRKVGGNIYHYKAQAYYKHTWNCYFGVHGNSSYSALWGFTYAPIGSLTDNFTQEQNAEDSTRIAEGTSGRGIFSLRDCIS